MPKFDSGYSQKSEAEDGDFFLIADSSAAQEIKKVKATDILPPNSVEAENINFATLDGDIGITALEDSGDQTLTINSQGLTGSITYRVIAGIVFIGTYSQLSGTVAEGNTTLTEVIPVGYRPAVAIRTAVYFSSGYEGTVSILATNGSIVITNRSGASRTNPGFGGCSAPVGS